jgi:hypothetical protein
MYLSTQIARAPRTVPTQYVAENKKVPDRNTGVPLVRNLT